MGTVGVDVVGVVVACSASVGGEVEGGGMEGGGVEGGGKEGGGVEGGGVEGGVEGGGEGGVEGGVEGGGVIFEEDLVSSAGRNTIERETESKRGICI